jgi:hypothetical protein
MTVHEARVILRRLRLGRQPSASEASSLQAEWVKRFGTGGCSYPYMAEQKMLEDIINGCRVRK